MPFSFSGLFKGDRQTPQQLVDHGIAAEEGGRTEEAVRCYRRAIERTRNSRLPTSISACSTLAGARYQEAEAAFRATLRLRESFPEAWVALADALEEQGRDAEALEALNRAIGAAYGLRRRAHEWRASSCRKWDASGPSRVQLPAGHRGRARTPLPPITIWQCAAHARPQRRGRSVFPALARTRARLRGRAHSNLGMHCAIWAAMPKPKPVAGRRSASTRGTRSPTIWAMFFRLWAVPRNRKRACARRSRSSPPIARRTTAWETPGPGPSRGGGDELPARIGPRSRRSRRARQPPARAQLHGSALARRGVRGAYPRLGAPARGALVYARRSRANLPDPRRRLRVGYVSPDFRRHSVAYFIEPGARAA